MTIRSIVVIFVVLAGHLAGATPRRSPTVTRSTSASWVHANALWLEVAKLKQDAPATADRWEPVALAFDAVVADPEVTGDAHVESALAAVAAWRYARANVREPTRMDHFDTLQEIFPLDDRDRHLIAAVERYLPIATKSEEIAFARVARATAHFQRNHFAEAIADYEVILEHHLDTEAVPYAAAALIESLKWQKQFSEMLRWIERLRASPEYVRADPEGAERLLEIELTQLVLGASWHYKRSDHQDFDEAALCLAGFDRASALAVANHRPPYTVEAAMCAAATGDVDDALRRLRTIPPTDRMYRHALRQISTLTARLEQFEDSAIASETYAAHFPHELDTAYELEDAAYYRANLGQLAELDRDVTTLLAMPKLPPGMRRAILRFVAPADRARGRRLIARIAAVEHLTPDDVPLVLDAACPVEPLDGMCLVDGTVAPRDPALVNLAAAALAGSTDHRLQAHVLFERALIAPAGERDRLALRAEAHYAQVAATPDVHFELGWLASRFVIAADARTEFATCAADGAGTAWLATCERALGESHPRPELAPTARAGSFAPDLDVPRFGYIDHPGTMVP